VHFGVKQRLTSKIISYDFPHGFIDQMQQGAFYFLRHTHTFVETDGGTLMLDKLDFAAPFGVLGWLAERIFLRQYMLIFIKRHQQEFRRIIEKD
jgi:ligand-binding SRPBCC domain-containing protein